MRLVRSLAGLSLILVLVQGLKKPKQVDCGTPAECEEAARQWLNNDFEPEYRQLLEFASQEDWEYNTDISTQHALDSVGLLILASKQITEFWTYVEQGLGNGGCL